MIAGASASPGEPLPGDHAIAGAITTHASVVTVATRSDRIAAGLVNHRATPPAAPRR